MGSPVSAVVANLYKEFFEELALGSAPSRPRLWKRYVDDTCCIVRKGDVDGRLNHVNSIRPTIKFTMELEEEGSLPFVDTRVIRLANGKLDITVYRQKDAHRQVSTLRVAPPYPCKERDGKVPLRSSSKSYATRREPEGGGEQSHEDFHREWLPSSLRTISFEATNTQRA